MKLIEYNKYDNTPLPSALGLLDTSLENFVEIGIFLVKEYEANRRTNNSKSLLFDEDRWSDESYFPLLFHLVSKEYTNFFIKLLTLEPRERGFPFYAVNPNQERNTLLHAAVNAENEKLVEILIEKHSDLIEEVNTNQETAISLVQNKITLLEKSSEMPQTDRLKSLHNILEKIKNKTEQLKQQKEEAKKKEALKKAEEEKQRQEKKRKKKQTKIDQQDQKDKKSGWSGEEYNQSQMGN